MRILTLDEIKNVLPSIDLITEIETAFAAYSGNRTVVPPVGELLLDKGEVHIKYGFIKGGSHYVIKIASGFYGNADLGLPNGNGLMLLFKQATGESAAILLDEGFLTDVRTAVAGAVSAKYLAPRKVTCIGILGTGVQARLQLEYLKEVTDCREVAVWGRRRGKLEEYATDAQRLGFKVRTTTESGDILRTCNLIVTTTPSLTPLLDSEDIRNGTHITAVGSDTPLKQELDPKILGLADIVIADSISQCLERGEIHHALKAGIIGRDMVIELGDVISGNSPGRTSDEQITVTDLTGVAVQDIAIAEAVFDQFH